MPHTYTLDGTKIQRETWGGNTLVPLYDNEDAVCGVIYNGTPYYFRKNLQGDIIAITDQNAETVARYTYDAWGVCTVTADTSGVNIAAVNPFRYRGYYYDTETGLYYLQSRYYDPTVGRFINADDPQYMCISLSVHGYNGYAYCNNNCVNLMDKTGRIALADDIVVLLFLGLCASLLLLCSQMSTSEFQKGWASFCTAVSNGLSQVGGSIARGGRDAWNWTRGQVKAAIVAISIYVKIVQAEAKVRAKTKSIRRNWNNFFEIWFDRIGAPILGRPLNRNKAVTRTRMGLNSITYYSSDALYVANRAGGSRAVWHQKHGGVGYFNHYHINGHANSAHIYYIVAG